MPPSALAIAFAILVPLLLAAQADAADGRIEIDQARALRGGVTPGDAAGFPVTLTAAGSYVLTSDLAPGPGQAAIDLQQEDITLDLNGFSLRGAAPSGGIASGIISSNAFLPAQEVTIRNGVVRNFRGRGIDLAASTHLRNRVEDVLLFDNDQGGLALGADGLVVRTRARANGGVGLQLGSRTAFTGCSATLNGGAGVSGGVPVSGNYCDDGTCSAKPRPRYYLTRLPFTGSQAPAACAPGFHFASLWEILDTSAQSYDTALGLTEDDSGSGPPLLDGWVRTGEIPFVGSTGSNANCAAWTSSEFAHFGTSVQLSSDWAPGSSGTYPHAIWPWTSDDTKRCNRSIAVWCVED